MSITYEEALSTLKSMFGEPWNNETLDAVLRHFEGHMENTIEAILNHRDGDPESLIAKLNSGVSPEAGTDHDEELARQLAAEEDQRRRAGPSSPSRIQRTAAPPATRRAAPTSGASSQKRGLGTPTELQPDFLRIPDYSYPSTIDTDEQLARMLQDEILQRELANSREFGHLASRRDRVGGVPPASPYPAPGGAEGPHIMEKLAGK